VPAYSVYIICKINHDERRIFLHFVGGFIRKPNYLIDNKSKYSNGLEYACLLVQLYQGGVEMKLSLVAQAVAAAISVGLLTVPVAQATWIQDDHVESAPVTGTGPYRYEFTVFNDSTDDCGGECNDPVPFIVDWELPYYADMGITNISSPWGWLSTIETIGVANAATGWSGQADWTTDPAWSGTGFASVTQVLHWYCDGTEGGGTGAPPSADNCWNDISPGGSEGGFGFDADFGPTNAPYQSSWDYTTPRRVGDPSFPMALAGSPCALGTATYACTAASSVPEPGTLGLLGGGLLASIAAAFRRRKSQNL
jgi:hypothetical protein